MLAILLVVVVNLVLNFFVAEPSAWWTTKMENNPCLMFVVLWCVVSFLEPYWSSMASPFLCFFVITLVLGMMEWWALLLLWMVWMTKSVDDNHGAWMMMVQTMVWSIQVA